jgi:hypothetical protein
VRRGLARPPASRRGKNAAQDLLIERTRGDPHPHASSRPCASFFALARRYERGSLLITTNQLVTQWGTVFGDEVLAAAILDRLLHHSHTLMIQGDSYRLKQKRKAGLIPAVPHREEALAGEPARADRRKP